MRGPYVTGYSPEFGDGSVAVAVAASYKETWFVRSRFWSKLMFTSCV